MTGFNVTINKSQLLKVDALLAGVKNGAPRVLSRAINKTLDGVRTDSVREVRNEIPAVKAKVVRDRFAIRKSSATSLSGRVDCRGENLGLIHFAPKQKKTGVSVRVKKTRKIVETAFIATAKGAENVFWRHYQPVKRGRVIQGFPYGRLPEKYRLPVIRLTGPAVPDIMSNESVLKVIENKADDRLSKNIDQQLQFELGKL